MKKKLLFIFLFIFMFTLTGCFEKGPGPNPGPGPDDKPENNPIYQIVNVHEVDDYQIDSKGHRIEIKIIGEFRKPIFSIDQIEIIDGEGRFIEDPNSDEELPPEIKLNGGENYVFLKVTDYKTEKTEIWEIFIFYLINEKVELENFEVLFNEKLKFAKTPTEEEVIKQIKCVKEILTNGEVNTLTYEEFQNKYSASININEYNYTIAFYTKYANVDYNYEKLPYFHDFKVTLPELYFEKEPTKEEVIELISEIEYQEDYQTYNFTTKEDITNFINKECSLEINEGVIKFTFNNLIQEFTYVLPTENTKLVANKIPLKDSLTFNYRPELDDVYSKLSSIELTHPDGKVDTIEPIDFVSKDGEVIIDYENNFILLTYKKYNLRCYIPFSIDYNYEPGIIRVHFKKDKESGASLLVVNKDLTLEDIVDNIQTITIRDEFKQNHNYSHSSEILDAYKKGEFNFTVDPKTSTFTFSCKGDVRPSTDHYLDLRRSDLELDIAYMDFYDNSTYYYNTLITFNKVDGKEISNIVNSVNCRFNGNDDNSYAIYDKTMIGEFIDKYGTLTSKAVEGETYTNYELKFPHRTYGFKYDELDKNNINEYSIVYKYSKFPIDLFNLIPLKDLPEVCVSGIRVKFNDGTSKIIKTEDYPVLYHYLEYTHKYDDPTYNDILSLKEDVLTKDKKVKMENMELIAQDLIKGEDFHIYFSNPCFYQDGFKQEDIKDRITRTTYVFYYHDESNLIEFDRSLIKDHIKFDNTEYKKGYNKVTYKVFNQTSNNDVILFVPGEEKMVYNTTFNLGPDYCVTDNAPTIEQLIENNVTNFTIYYYDGTTQRVTTEGLIYNPAKYNITYRVDTVYEDEGYRTHEITITANGFDNHLSVKSILTKELKNPENNGYRTGDTIFLNDQNKDFRITYENYLNYINNDNEYNYSVSFDDPRYEGKRATAEVRYIGEDLKALLEKSGILNVKTELANSKCLRVTYEFEVFDNYYGLVFYINTTEDITTVEPRLDVITEKNKDGVLEFQFQTSQNALADLTLAINFFDEYNVEHRFNKEKSQIMMRQGYFKVYFSNDYVSINAFHEGKYVTTTNIDYVMNPNPEFIPYEIAFTTGNGYAIDYLYTYNLPITMDLLKNHLQVAFLSDSSDYRQIIEGEEKNNLLNNHTLIRKIDDEYFLEITYGHWDKHLSSLPIIDFVNPKYEIESINVLTGNYPAYLYNQLSDKEIIQTLFRQFEYYENPEGVSIGNHYTNTGYCNDETFYDAFSLEKGANSFKVLFRGKPVKMIQDFANNVEYSEIKVTDTPIEKIEFSSLQYQSIVLEDIKKDSDLFKYNNGYFFSYKCPEFNTNYSHKSWCNFDLYMTPWICEKYAQINFLTTRTQGVNNKYRITLFNQTAELTTELHNRANGNDAREIYLTTQGFIVDNKESIDYAKLFDGYMRLYKGLTKETNYINVDYYLVQGKSWISKYNPKFELINIEMDPNIPSCYVHNVRLSVKGYSTMLKYRFVYKSDGVDYVFNDTKFGKNISNFDATKYGVGFEITNDNVYDVIDPEANMIVINDYNGYYGFEELVNAKEWLMANTTANITKEVVDVITTKYKVEFMTSSGKCAYSNTFKVYNKTK